MAKPRFRCQVSALRAGIEIETPRAGVYPPTSLRSKVPIVNVRKAPRVVLSLVALVVASACLDTTAPAAANSEIRIINASEQTLNIFMDDRLAIDQSQQSDVSLIQLASGDHKLTFRNANGVETPLPITTTPAGFRTTYVYTNSSGEVVAVLLDTIVPPPPGQASVRVVNLSRVAGSVDVYGSQPPGAQGVAFGTAMSFLAESPSMQKDAGVWDAYYTLSGSTQKVLSADEFPIESQGRRTLILIDIASVPVFRLLLN